MTNDNGYRALIDRIEPQLKRIDQENPASADALRIIAEAFGDFRLTVLGEFEEARKERTEDREDRKAMRRTLNALLVAMLPFTGALIYVGQQVTG